MANILQLPVFYPAIMVIMYGLLRILLILKSEARFIVRSQVAVTLL